MAKEKRESLDNPSREIKTITIQQVAKFSVRHWYVEKEVLNAIASGDIRSFFCVEFGFTYSRDRSDSFLAPVNRFAMRRKILQLDKKRSILDQDQISFGISDLDIVAENSSEILLSEPKISDLLLDKRDFINWRVDIDRIFEPKKRDVEKQLFRMRVLLRYFIIERYRSPDIYRFDSINSIVTAFLNSKTYQDFFNEPGGQRYGVSETALRRELTSILGENKDLLELPD